MEKYFCDYNQSLALKELGFDEPCLGVFYLIPETKKWEPYRIMEESNHNKSNFSISRPLIGQVFEWFRKEYRIISVIDFYCDNDEWEDTMYEVRISEFKHFKTHDSFVQSEYKSYEEAESACIDKLIELCNDK